MDIQVKTDAQSSLITVNGFLNRQDLALKREYKKIVMIGIGMLCLVVLKFRLFLPHYRYVIMDKVVFQITSLTIVYFTVYSDADQRKHQSSASLAFVRGIHRERWIPRTNGQ